MDKEFENHKSLITEGQTRATWRPSAERTAERRSTVIFVTKELFEAVPSVLSA